MGYFDKYYDSFINNNLDKLAFAFTKYFGNQYENVIKNKIESIIFIWYKHYLFDEFYKLNKDKVKVDNIDLISLYDSNEIIGSTKNIDKYKNIFHKLLCDNKDILGTNINIYKNNSISSFVLFPIIMCNDKNLIHEIEHSIVYDILFDKHNNITFKSGLFLGKIEEKVIEELINERSAIDICSLFHNIGGNILDIKPIKLYNTYNNYLPLIENFYIKYLDILKAVRISNNYSLLFKYVNENIYEEYIKFVYKIYSDMEKKLCNNEECELDVKYVLKANEYVDMMELGNNKQLKLVKD